MHLSERRGEGGKLLSNLLVGAAVMILLLALSYLLFLPHYTLAIRILIRPVVHNVFNISLAIYFAINATGGPFLLFFYYKALHNFLWEKLEETDKSDCSRLMELRHMEGEGFKIISSNIMFRSEAACLLNIY